MSTVTDVFSLGNTYWNVPCAPNPLFTGRRSLLDEMKKYLTPEPDNRDPSVFVIQGIGGAGKSETAVKFAAENLKKYVPGEKNTVSNIH
jgi:hypothetical protein